MERAVARRGGDYQYPKRGEAGSEGYYTQSTVRSWMPSYSTEGGEATCIVGAALVEAGANLPNHREVRGANSVLQVYGLSLPVRIAARAAQIHQDHSKPWSEALAVYHAALGIAEGISTRGRRWLSEFDYLTIYHEAVFQVTKEPAPISMTMQAPGVIDLSKITQSINDLKKAMGDMAEAANQVTVPMPPAPPALFTEEPVFPVVNVPKVTFNITANPTVMSLIYGGQIAPPMKKDHALVA